MTLIHIVITGSIVYNAKIDPRTALLNEDIKHCPMLQLVVRGSNQNREWARDSTAAYRSEEFKKYLESNNNGLWYYPLAGIKLEN